ncbi:2-dehydro-3-deoxyphosphooctonate aldolase [candidate division TA06 bacterium DG_24]|uniref:3-deoxy-8-phosphooctulonate synthase n=2 Tax=Bacteria division TA06 TaxID=1156500 RepID=A0A0S8JL53_UNCT6|nr:MAG: 2-dehydro-3-deoxyphosphooctonate aldolase [candidate division TA06 bacterium DG_24]KPL10098.1 MAG: 2-dehydro-3-deoxyphosphooctonate aldolase [candidate division TA06 bacterium SM1_40]
MVSTVRVGGVQIGPSHRLALIAGPCVIEDEKTLLTTAEQIRAIGERAGIGVIFKSSYWKDNRSDAGSYAGPGLAEGLRLLEKVRREVGLPVLSDVHCRTEVEHASAVLDALQVPAYLSQQTRLVLAAGRSGKPVNLKKGQFVSPNDMSSAVRKVESTGNRQILLTERGSCFGYRTLVVDYRSLPILRSLGYPVVFDVTHAIRIYGVPSSDPRGGERQYIPALARAAVACGCDAMFIETHPRPADARCDAASMLPLDKLERLVEELVAIDDLVRNKEGVHLDQVSRKSSPIDEG